MLYVIHLCNDRDGSDEKIVERENINDNAAIIEFGAFYKALGYKFILMGRKEQEGDSPEYIIHNCYPYRILYGKWEDDEVIDGIKVK